VIVPANTFIASILGIQAAGLIPILAEPNPKSHNLSVSTISDALTSNVRAILVVHLYGRIAPMDEILAFAESRDLLVLEDAAQAHGAMLGSRRAGSFGIAAAFSFYPAKNLGALGDAGAVVTSDGQLAGLVRELGNYGSQKKYVCDQLGVNSRLDEMQAAMLSVKLSRLDIDNAKRRSIAGQYVAGMHNVRVKTPQIPEGEQHVWHQFVVECNHRDSLQNFLLEHGVQTQVHYPIPPHQQRAFEGCPIASLRFPVTELLALTVLSLPMDPCMSSEEIEHVIRSVNAFES
jgi:dTDP-4-amino-4,6-dideoxygalactose transaminase